MIYTIQYNVTIKHRQEEISVSSSGILLTMLNKFTGDSGSNTYCYNYIVKIKNN